MDKAGKSWHHSQVTKVHFDDKRISNNCVKTEGFSRSHCTKSAAPRTKRTKTTTTENNSTIDTAKSYTGISSLLASSSTNCRNISVGTTKQKSQKAKTAAATKTTTKPFRTRRSKQEQQIESEQSIQSEESTQTNQSKQSDQAAESEQQKERKEQEQPKKPVRLEQEEPINKDVVIVYRRDLVKSELVKEEDIEKRENTNETKTIANSKSKIEPAVKKADDDPLKIRIAINIGLNKNNSTPKEGVVERSSKTEPIQLSQETTQAKKEEQTKEDCALNFKNGNLQFISKTTTSSPKIPVLSTASLIQQAVLACPLKSGRLLKTLNNNNNIIKRYYRRGPLTNINTSTATAITSPVVTTPAATTAGKGQLSGIRVDVNLRNSKIRIVPAQLQLHHFYKAANFVNQNINKAVAENNKQKIY